MSDKLRIFNNKGLKKIKEELNTNTSDERTVKIFDKLDLDSTLLQAIRSHCFDADLTEEWEGGTVDIENNFNPGSTWDDVAKYIDSLLGRASFDVVRYSEGFWNWLSVYFVEGMTEWLPANKNDGFPPFYYSNGGRAPYRHRLRTYWLLHRAGTGKSLLKEEAFKAHSAGKADWYEAILGRRAWFAVPSVIEAFEHMYCDGNYDLKTDSEGRGPRTWGKEIDYDAASKDITKLAASFDLRCLSSSDIRSKLNAPLRSL